MVILHYIELRIFSCFFRTILRLLSNVLGFGETSCSTAVMVT